MDGVFGTTYKAIFYNLIQKDSSNHNLSLIILQLASIPIFRSQQKRSENILNRALIQKPIVDCMRPKISMDKFHVRLIMTAMEPEFVIMGIVRERVDAQRLMKMPSIIQ